MPINITTNQSGSDTSINVPDVSGMNVANTTVAPAPPAGTPTVTPNQNPYAAEPFKQKAQIGNIVQETANKAAEYIKNIQATQEANKADTIKGQWKLNYDQGILKAKQALRQQQLSDNPDAVTKVFQGVLDDAKQKAFNGWAPENSAVSRMVSRYGEAMQNYSSEQQMEFVAGEVKQNASNQFDIQTKTNLDNYKFAMRKQEPGESKAAADLRRSQAPAIFQAAQAKQTTDPYLLGQFGLDLAPTVARNTAKGDADVGSELLSELVSSSKYTGDPTKDAAIEADNNAMLANWAKQTGLSPGDQTTLLDNAEQKIHEARIVGSNAAYEQQRRATELVSQHFEAEIAQRESDGLTAINKGNFNPNLALATNNAIQKEIWQNPTLSKDQKMLYAARANESAQRQVMEYKKSEDERQNTIQAASQGNEAARNKVFNSWSNNIPEIKNKTIEQYTPQQLSMTYGLIDNSLGHLAPTPYIDSMVSAMLGQDPHRMAANLPIYKHFADADPQVLAQIAEKSPIAARAYSYLAQGIPIADVQSYVQKGELTKGTETTETIDKKFSEGKKAAFPGQSDAEAEQSDMRTLVDLVNPHGSFGSRQYSGLDRTVLPADLVATRDNLTKYFIGQGHDFKSARQLADGTLANHGLGVNPNGPDGPQIQLNPPQKVAGLKADILENDVRNAFSKEGSPIPDDARVVINSTGDTRVKNGVLEHRFEIKWQNKDNTWGGPGAPNFWYNPTTNVIMQDQNYNKTAIAYNALITNKAHAAGVLTNIAGHEIPNFMLRQGYKMASIISDLGKKGNVRNPPEGADIALWKQAEAQAKTEGTY